MQNKTASENRFIQNFHIHHRLDGELFEWQLRRFFTEMGRRAESWKGPGDGDHISLDALDQQLFEIHGLTSQALRFLAHLSVEENWHRSKNIEIGQALAVLHLNALDGRLEIDALDFREVFAADARVGLILSVTSNPNAREIKANDFAGWTQMLSRPYPGMRVVDDLPAKPAKKAWKKPAIHLTDSQHELAKALKSFWKLKKSGAQLGGYDLRPIPLIVGPSGSGKSALVRHFAESNKLPMREYNVGTWVITGAKTEPNTLTAMARFIAENEQGVIYLDEVDKLFGDTDWMRMIQQEVYALLDGRTDSFHEWTDTTRAKLETNFFFVGAGTWQSLYAKNQRELGFKTDQSGNDWSIDLAAQKVIPDELLMRFNADVLFLQPMKVEELSKRIASIVAEAGFGRINSDRLQDLAEKAHASGRHNRWLEAYAGRLLRRHPSAC